MDSKARKELKSFYNKYGATQTLDAILELFRSMAIWERDENNDTDYSSTLDELADEMEEKLFV